MSYDNAAGKVKLAGTLSIPRGDGPHPAVLLVSGSGQQDRDETMFGHKPFWVIADYFARQGIATLRVDDRGLGGSSGDPATATTEDFVGDAIAGVAFLARQPRIDGRRVGIVGHSEGGLVGPAAAARSKQVRFLVMLAGPGVPGRELLPRQVERTMQAAGAPAADVERGVALQREVMAILGSERDDAKARARVLEALTRAPGVDTVAPRPQIDGLFSPWFRTFLAFDPGKVLAKVKVPVLALVGELDVQVDAEQNAGAIRKALRKAGNRRSLVRRIPGLNHLFQHAKTGSVAEYGGIEETFAPEVLALMAEWIVAAAPAP